MNDLLLTDDLLELEDIQSLITTEEWVQTEVGVRSTVYAKKKHDGLVHVIHFYYDEDGFKSREVYVGSTYAEAVSSERILNHWETFEPIDFDDDWDDDEDE